MAIAPIPRPRSARPPATGDIPGTVDPHSGGGFLGNAFGWNGNEFYDGFRKVADSGILEDLGYGLLNSTNLGDAFAMAGNRGLQMAPYRRAETEELEQRQKYSELLESWGPEYADFAAGIRDGAFDPADGYWKALDYKRETTQSQQELERARANAQFITDPQLRGMVEAGALPFAEAYKYQTQGGANPRDIALQPQWFKDPATGEMVMGQLADDGTLVRTETGGLQPVTPQELYTGRAFGAALGGAQGDAAAAAPSDIQAAQTALSLIEDIRSDPELPWATGTSAGIGGNMIPGTGRFGFQKKVDQAKSGAFLTAIQEMRGMGALSNAEGQTATAAVTRMDTALSKADFEAALADYEAIITRGLESAQRRLTMPPGMPGAGGPASAGGMPTAINPATGERVVFDGQQWIPAQ